MVCIIFFTSIGDQTGRGKSRIISLVLRELEILGHKKAFWASASSVLSFNADEELRKVKCDMPVIPLNKEFVESRSQQTAEPDQEGGILFSAYSNLTTKGENSNLFAVAKWLGQDFSGCLII